jgi:hypothetical protein
MLDFGGREIGRAMHQEETEIPRRFLLVDAIILIAAAALMLSSHRAIWWFWVWGDPTASYSYRETRLMAGALALSGLSFILLVSVLAHPTGPRRLRRGAPGLFVPVAVASVLAVRVCGWAAQALINHAFSGRAGFFYAIRPTVEVMNDLRDDIRRDVVVAVAATWLTLAIVGRWRPERAWDDRLGRSLGVVWIVFYLCAPLHVLLP